MASGYDLLLARTVSAHPVSIGTSLALESVFKGRQAPYDPDRPIPEHIAITHYKEFWINLSTLFRNIVGACPASLLQDVSAAAIAHFLEEEVQYLHDLVTHETMGQVRPVFYINRYDGLQEHLPHARLRIDSTIKQKVYAHLLKTSLEHFLKHQLEQRDVREFVLRLKPAAPTRALILTHYAYDLVSEQNFTELDLLESHTGVRKPKALWYTKLADGKGLMRIPFMEAFLAVFGDSQTFHPMDRELRLAVVDLAERYRWTALTTRDRVFYSVSSLSNPEYRELLKSMI